MLLPYGTLHWLLGLLILLSSCIKINKYPKICCTVCNGEVHIALHCNAEMHTSYAAPVKRHALHIELLNCKKLYWYHAYVETFMFKTVLDLYNLIVVNAHLGNSWLFKQYIKYSTAYS